MTREEAVNWIINISADIGKVQHQELWHYEQALAEIKELLEMPQWQKTGKWAQVAFSYRCSACQEDSDWPSEYCPWCGAKMGEEQ